MHVSVHTYQNTSFDFGHSLRKLRSSPKTSRALANRQQPATPHPHDPYPMSCHSRGHSNRMQSTNSVPEAARSRLGCVPHRRGQPIGRDRTDASCSQYIQPHASRVALPASIEGGGIAAAADAAAESPSKPRASRERAEPRAAHTRVCERASSTDAS